MSSISKSDKEPMPPINLSLSSSGKRIILKETKVEQSDDTSGNREERLEKILSKEIKEQIKRAKGIRDKGIKDKEYIDKINEENQEKFENIRLTYVKQNHNINQLQLDEEFINIRDKAYNKIIITEDNISKLNRTLRNDISDINLILEGFEKRLKEFYVMKVIFEGPGIKQILRQDIFAKVEKYSLELKERFKNIHNYHSELNNILTQKLDITKKIKDSKFDNQCEKLFNDLQSLDKKEISILHENTRILAKGYVAVFPLENITFNKCLKKKYTLKLNDELAQHKESFDLSLNFIKKMHQEISSHILAMEKIYNAHHLHTKDALPLWDKEITKPKTDILMLKELYNRFSVNGMEKTSAKFSPEQHIEYAENFIQSLEAQASKSADYMMRLLIEEEQDITQQASSSVPSASKQKFTPSKKDDTKTSQIIPETLSSSEASPEEQYNEKLNAKWNNYFRKTDYRDGEWSGKKNVPLPLMTNYFPSQMKFTLSPKEVIAHLKRRHQELVKELSETEKKDIKDEDNFEFNISGQSLEIHNLIYELASQLSHKETVIYKSASHISDETGEIINNPTIMVKGKNKAGDIMLSAWGLYEAEKQDGIKLHLLSYYKEDKNDEQVPINAEKSASSSKVKGKKFIKKLLPTEIKISNFSGEVTQEIEEKELLKSFEETNILEKTSEQKYKDLTKGKGKKKK